MDYITIIQTLINLILISLLIYAWFYAIPEQRELFYECNEKILCEQKILKGSICDKYEKNFDINVTIGTITTTP